MKLKKKITIYDIAKVAGVSHTTVSRIINNRDAEIPIGKSTTERVLQLIKELDYHPRAYRSRKTDSIAFVFSKVTIQSLISDPFYSKVLEGVEQEATEHSFNIFITGLKKEMIDQFEFPLTVRRNYVDSMILAGAIDDEYLNRVLPSLEIPYILLDNWTKKISVTSIVSEGRKGMVESLSHLAGLGHKRIAYIDSIIPSYNFSERFQGYIEGMKTHNLSSNSDYMVKGAPWGCEDCNVMNKLLDLNPRPTAVLCANDNIALSAVKCITAKGLKIPADISVVGFEDIDACKFVSPALTTVCVDKKEMGAEAVRQVIGRMRNPELPIQTVSIKTILKIRESTGKPA